MTIRRVSTSARQGTPLGLRVRGSSLAALVVLAEPGRTRMTAEIHGPESVLDSVTGELHGDIWVLTFPRLRVAHEACTGVFWVPEGTEVSATLPGRELITAGQLGRVS